MKFEEVPWPGQGKGSRSAPDPEFVPIIDLVWKTDGAVKLSLPVPKDDMVLRTNSRGPYEMARAVERARRGLALAANLYETPFKVHTRVNEDKNRRLIRNEDGTVDMWVRRGKTRAQIAMEKESKS